MIKRVFTSEDQLDFAKLSGDCNPLHLDPMLARRLVFGRQAVHGLHALLWSLDSHLKHDTGFVELQTVKANFQAGIGVGQSVVCRITEQDGFHISIKLETDGALAAWFEIRWVRLRQHRPQALPENPPDRQICRELFLDDVAAASGSIALYLNRNLADRLFPNLSRAAAPLQLGALLATTRLVGMECPGTHSILASLNLSFHPVQAGDAKLSYRVMDCNRRLALVSMDVETPGMEGQIKAFVRPLPRSQAAFTEIRRHVDPGEFSDQRALVVGGSRGLGEVTAKLLAAGGAEVVLTFFQGQQDALNVVEDIVSNGAAADCCSLDVLEPSQGLANKFASQSRPLYLYYFATPFIFGAARGKFSSQRFAAFSALYVTGFLNTVQAVSDPSAGLQKVFYPSSAAIDELPLDMGEYAAAKMAGECLCDYLQKAHVGLTIHKPRLPRIATDQTNSLLPVKNQEPVSILLNHLRNLRRM